MYNIIIGLNVTSIFPDWAEFAWWLNSIGEGLLPESHSETTWLNLGKRTTINMCGPTFKSMMYESNPDQLAELPPAISLPQPVLDIRYLPSQPVLELTSPSQFWLP